MSPKKRLWTTTSSSSAHWTSLRRPCGGETCDRLRIWRRVSDIFGLGFLCLHELQSQTMKLLLKLCFIFLYGFVWQFEVWMPKHCYIFSYAFVLFYYDCMASVCFWFVMAVSTDVYSDVYNCDDCRHIYLQFELIIDIKCLQSPQL